MIMLLEMTAGVFIESLDYMPGVHSRRWYGDETDDHGRNQKILELLKNETENRKAYLISRFSLVNHDGDVIAKENVKNLFIIANEEHGKFGFGYDTILIPSLDMVADAYNRDNIKAGEIFETLSINSTIGEMTQDEKNFITYRGRIAKEIANILKRKNESGE